MDFCVLLFPPNKYEMAHNKIELANFTSSMMFSFNKSTINLDKLHFLSLFCVFTICY